MRARHRSAAAAWTCNGATGLTAPVPLCSPSSPCTSPHGPPVTSPFTLPTCKTKALERGREHVDDGPARTWRDVDGDERAACVFTPKAPGPHPLLLFFHGSKGSADSVYDHTSLRKKAAEAVLSADPGRRGFVLAAMQGRNLFLPWQPHFGGSHHDFWYRDLGSPSCNPDIRSADKLIDDLVATAAIDPNRIYVSGWSNGAFFAQAYAIARHTTATPGGNRVAAAALFAGADPFDNLLKTQSPSCKLERYPTSSVPTLMVHRACDALVACDSAQNTEFKLPPGGDVTDWMERLGALVGDRSAKATLIDASGHEARACAPVSACSPEVGLEGHLNWPDGVADRGGVDWEVEMIAFLRAHPR
jgi:poly(3-hydroxybutyrate) depolymerase